MTTLTWSGLALERITLLGHSWGAMLAAAYVAAHLERVDRLVLVGPGPLWWDLKFLEGHAGDIRDVEPGVAAGEAILRYTDDVTFQVFTSASNIMNHGSASRGISDTSFI